MLVHGPKISINRFQLCGWYSSVEWKLWSSVECVTRNCLVKLWWSGDKGLSSWRLGSSADSKCGSRCVWQSVWLHHVAFVNHVQARAAWRPATCMGFSSSWATFWRGLCVITVSKNIISFIVRFSIPLPISRKRIIRMVVAVHWVYFSMRMQSYTPIESTCNC